MGARRERGDAGVGASAGLGGHGHAAARRGRPDRRSHSRRRRPKATQHGSDRHAPLPRAHPEHVDIVSAKDGTIRIPPQLAKAVDDDADDYPDRPAWLAALPAQVKEITSEWELELRDPYRPGGQCAWVA